MTEETQPPIPYQDFSESQRKEAVATELAAIAADEKVIVKKRQSVNDGIVAIINAFFRQGGALQRACGHQQVTFSFIQTVADRLPWGKDPKAVFERARRSIAITCRLEKEIEKWEDISADSRKAILTQLELLAVVGRDSMGPVMRTNDPFVAWLADITRAKQGFQKACRMAPLETRPHEQIEEFLADTQWIADERAKAESLLK